MRSLLFFANGPKQAPAATSAAGTEVEADLLFSSGPDHGDEDITVLTMGTPMKKDSVVARSLPDSVVVASMREGPVADCNGHRVDVFPQSSAESSQVGDAVSIGAETITIPSDAVPASASQEPPRGEDRARTMAVSRVPVMLPTKPITRATMRVKRVVVMVREY